MRIVILASGDLWAGAENMIFTLASCLLNKEEVVLRVVLLNYGKLASDLETAGVEVIVLDETEHSFFSIVAKLRYTMLEFQPDVVHSHRYKENLLAWLTKLFLRSSDFSLIATQHGLPEIIRSKRPLSTACKNYIFFKLLAVFFDQTIVVSYDMQRLLNKRYGFSAKKSSVIHNGIELPPLLPRSSRKDIIVGSAGRFFPVKDFALMVEVANIACRINRNISFEIAGDGPEYNTLKKLVDSYQLNDRFRFLGHQEDMHSFYQRLDIYMNTSVHEGIPMSVLEAMSHSLPVICGAVGGFAEIISDTKEGYLIGDRDKNEYVARIVTLVEDERLRNDMGATARNTIIAKFSQAAMTDKYIDIYKEYTALK